MANKLQLIILSALLFIASTSVFGQIFENGEIGITLNDYGRVRVYLGNSDSLVQIDRFSVLVGSEIDKVFDYTNDAEMVDSARNIDNSLIGDYELYVSTDNMYSELPPNFLVSVRVYGWNTGGFGLAKFTLVNHEADGISSSIGFEAIAKVDGIYGFESSEYISDINTMDIFVGDASTHTGFQVLTQPLKTLHSIDWVEGYSDNDTLFWANLNYGSLDALFESGSDGSVNFMGLNPISMNVDDTVSVWVAIAVGANRDEMKTNMLAATAKYQLITDVEKVESKLPDSYSLSQNYPNPFNPATQINFSITQSEYVSLSVYNSLGEKVSDLVNGELSKGNYTVNFDASNLSSGIYFYKILTNSFSSVKKMMVLK
ncbi:MAG: T9SS type A sorting domain-containing protein [Bacteroidetes bacterium]|nr:T9SS type A sorting domain-containing protein [Bacteroidota bacterium]MBU1113944.1 T9SS type A sorting domain-containing protein [Bacteroidota bacterium]MBU1798261.1 T9SS type A sorting domain-containing protein [Bacteroidota bacterium]